MNPRLVEVGKIIQMLASRYIPRAYALGRGKVSSKYRLFKPWDASDNANIEVLLNRHGIELAKSLANMETALAEGETLETLIEGLLDRTGLWAWVLSPAMAAGMAAGVDDSRREIARQEGLPVDEIGIIWLTAEDEKVCKKCLYMAGRWFDAHHAYDIASTIHPHCRCPAHFDVGTPSEAMVGPLPGYRPDRLGLVYGDLGLDDERARRRQARYGKPPVGPDIHLLRGDI